MVYENVVVDVHVQGKISSTFDPKTCSEEMNKVMCQREKDGWEVVSIMPIIVPSGYSSLTAGCIITFHKAD